MKRFALIVAAALITGSAAAQRHRIGEINTETEEGKVLQAIGTEEDAARKIQLMEGFVTKWGSHEAAGWVWSQLQPAYAKAGNFDKALEAGEKLLTMDPLDIEAAFGSLKAAEGKKDSAAVLKWAASASGIARKAAQQPKGAEQEEEDHKRAVDFAKHVDTYTEYALFATALTETNPEMVMQLAELLEQQSPQSQYVPQILGRYTWAAREAQTMPNALALGERAVSRGQLHEDLLLAMADYHINQPPAKRDNEKIIDYSNKLVELMNTKPKPDGVSDEDWQKRKDTMMGLGHWMAGTTYGSQSKFSLADKSLRAALPLIKDNDQLLAGALFHLGLANYQMGKGRNAQQISEAMKFMQQCASMKSPFQAQAAKNVSVMTKETGRK